MSLDGERYTALIGLGDDFAHATSSDMVCAALTARAPAMVGGYDAVVFARTCPSGEEACHFEPLGRDGGQLPVRGFQASWPIGRPAMVNRPTTQAAHSPYQPMWKALGELEPGSIAHLPVGPDAVLVVLFRAENRMLSRDEWTLLASVAEQAAAAIERVQALSRVTELSLRDDHTGLANRRMLELMLQHRFADAMRGEALSVVSIRPAEEPDPLALSYAEIDPNVRRIAELLRSQPRGSDVPAHMGEGVFVVLLHAARRAGAEAFLRRLQAEIDDVEVVCAVAEHDFARFKEPQELLAAVVSGATDAAWSPPRSDTGGAPPRTDGGRV